MTSFKIDAKEEFTLIAPTDYNLDAAFTAFLADKCQELTQKGSLNFIIDLGTCSNTLPNVLEPLIALSATQYEQENSFVLVHAPTQLLQLIKDEDAIDSLNYAPTMEEAIDIVRMEILERNMFGDE
ncbi:MAG: hypothetical protein IT256_02465 [Chitinophagaceae bacterium]|nr:hypothetical protein [Chitinophagaceae bacterium]